MRLQYPDNIYHDLKVVGKEVWAKPVTPTHSRNSEGTFIRLKDGRIMYAYSCFGPSGDDDASSDIAAVYSSDEGETWHDDSILFPRGDARTIMAPSFVRMQNGDLGMFYAYKIVGTNRDYVRLVRSSDEGKTWSEPVNCTPDGCYFVYENGHAIRLKSGRLIIPASFHPSDGSDALDGINLHGLMTFFGSDDDGKTWRELSERMDAPYPDAVKTGLQEPMVYQSEDGTLRAFARCNIGYQCEAVSTDEGETWTDPRPNLYFTSPVSPMMMKRAGKYTLAVRNPIAWNPVFFNWGYGYYGPGRTPLVCDVSENDGKTFDRTVIVDGSWELPLCYPDLFDGGDYTLISYQRGNGGVIRKIMLKELE